MDWKSVAIEKLKDYEAKRQALEGIPLEIAMVESSMSSIRSARTDGVPVRGGGSKYEDRMLSCIVQKEELANCLHIAQLWVDGVQAALGVLDRKERKAIECMYIIGERGAAENLASEFFVDSKTIYRWKDIALRKFTIALYGVTET